MESATIREVQHNLAAYLRRVEHGEDIVIRRRNKVVARLVSAGRYDATSKPLDWGKVRERREAMWGGRPAPGKPGSAIVRDSRGDR
jgi:prevent-host-death family protein